MFKMIREISPMTVTQEDVADIWRCTRQTVHKWITSGLLKSYTMPGSRIVRTTLEDVAFATQRGDGKPGTREFFLKTVRLLYRLYASKNPDGEIPSEEELKPLWEDYARRYEAAQFAT